MVTKRSDRGFTLSELIVVLVLLVLLLLLPGLMKQRRNGSGLETSINNVRQILAATAKYRLDNADRVPMRGTSYTQGTITGGWDTWNAFGKNCDFAWSGSVFDENAYGRALNQYLFHVRIPKPAGYISTGSGSTWNFNDGTITAQQRASLQIPVCRSPGDISSFQSGAPAIGRSSYDDVGTSYHLNMYWWSQPGWPSSFTQRFNAGTERIRTLVHDPVHPFTWIADQTTGRVANASFSGFRMKGEFGGVNKSVMGFLDGTADYRTVAAAIGVGDNYTLLLSP